MDCDTLLNDVESLGSAGVVLSTEQKVLLQTSLTLLKEQYKFRRVFFWGKILGIKDDYFLAQGVENDELKDRKTLYSNDCVNWKLLPPSSEDAIAKGNLAAGRFTGDPSFVFEYIEMKKVIGDEGEVRDEAQPPVAIKEEEKLVATIAQIDQDCAIVPRAAYNLTATGKVVQSRTFEGLRGDEAAKLHSYLHFRVPKVLPRKPLVERINLEKAIDFLDPIDEDVPKGAWSLQFERGNGLVYLKNLLWPGSVFYHVPGTSKHGHVYVGLGQLNIDIPFMI